MEQKTSAALFEEAKQVIPGGVNSPVRSFANVEMPPIFVDHASGAYIYDVEGHAYLDYIGSWGPMILGHAHPLLSEHLQEVVEKGISYGLCTPKEVELATCICEAYPGVDMVRMVNSGTEATMSAIRVARGYTKRDKIIKFEGCYHGHSDGLLVKSGSGALTFGMPTSPGVPADVVHDTIVCTYNDIASLKQAFSNNKDEIAAVIVEPIAGNMGLIPAQKDFLEAMRTICDEEGSVLIFDEVISGFRIDYQGAAGWYGITPDMACFGKIIGAGMPVGAYGGRREIMSCVSPCGPVYQAGTLSGNPLAMELGYRLLTYLKQHKEVYTQLNEHGVYLKEGIKKILQEEHLPYQIQQAGSLLTLFFCERMPIDYQDVQACDRKAYTIFFKSLLRQHILIAPSPFEAMFLSAAHSKADLDRTLQAMRVALQEVKEHVLSR